MQGKGHRGASGVQENEYIIELVGCKRRNLQRSYCSWMQEKELTEKLVGCKWRDTKLVYVGARRGTHCLARKMQEEGHIEKLVGCKRRNIKRS